jgi:hypothetical protein
VVRGFRGGYGAVGLGGGGAGGGGGGVRLTPEGWLRLDALVRRVA